MAACWKLQLAARSKMIPYAELHAHTAFSFLDGASMPDALVHRATELELEALAITDHDGFPGLVQAANSARTCGLPLIAGTEISVGASAARNGQIDPDGNHLVLLARNPAGYRFLSRTIGTAMLASGNKGETHYTELENTSGDVLALTGCRKGSVRRALEANPGSWGIDAALAAVEELKEKFGGNVVVELSATGAPLDRERCAALSEVARRARVPAVVTGNVHYARPTDRPVADVLAATRAGRSLDEMDPYLPANGTFLRSGAQMLELHPERRKNIELAAEIGADCAFDLQLIAPQLPPYPVPAGHTESSYLRELVAKAARERYGMRQENPEAWKLIDHELQIIIELGFPGYFLIVHEIVEFCAQQGIWCQGRGSAANSAVCYALGITAVDAVRHKMLFERFLSPGRSGPPDIDLDIESGRREEVIQHVYSRYGRDNAAQVANVISYRPRSAIRDAARALGYSRGQAEGWMKSREPGSHQPGNISHQPGSTSHQPGNTESSSTGNRSGTANNNRTENSEPGCPESAKSTANRAGQIPRAVEELAARMQKLPRHLGIHSSGMILCDRPVIDVCPVGWATMPGRTVVQWDKDDCASAGFVKFDLLGLGMLTALRLAFESIGERGVRAPDGSQLALHNLPQEDPRVYELLQAADTVGVFQVESRAQMATLPRLRPTCFYDIVIEVALIRPGPIQGRSVNPYLRRRRGEEPVTYAHELLRPALEKTLGVPLFQEQLMQIAMDAAGFSAADADRLRKAMGAKRSAERMEELREKLLAGMAKNGIEPAVREEIYEKLRAFAEFGFPESHAFSFAYLVYASAWLKVHHPEDFYAALLAAQPLGFYSPQTLVADARSHGVAVKRADVTTAAEKASVLAYTEDQNRAQTGRPETGSIPTTETGERGGSYATGTERPRGSTAETAEKPSGLAAPAKQSQVPAKRLVDASSTHYVQLGLDSIKGLGRGAQRIVQARAEKPFTNVADLAQRAQLSEKEIETLATAGALRSLGVTRRQGIWLAHAVEDAGITEKGWYQPALPGTEALGTVPVFRDMSPVEKNIADIAATGLSPDSYPTQFLRPHLQARGVLKISELAQVPEKTRVRAAGIVTHRQRPGTAKGITFLSLEDETGLLNVLVSPALWHRYRAVALRAQGLIVRGMLERDSGAQVFIADGMEEMPLPVNMPARDFR
ncbi:DNA polymerase III subunit alpha [Actinobaculum suis]|uniref:DNA polymerase III subunit alpha n=1 Tax=Actinobaculum suis TaxID=1657 RepID=UPI00066FD454|nr:DNA polymerase III subunit alpha [Actinobaculum suis]KMY22659.1 DNA polymerase III subunit alpha [Actinobaculum suis]